MKNIKSAITKSDFVNQAICDLIDSWCAYAVPLKPYIVNPLIVATHKSVKMRLILDLSALNKFAKKGKIQNGRLENIHAVLKKKDNYLLKYDFKSGYHHFNNCPQQQTYLGFSLENIFYCFPVVVFGLASSPY